MIDCNQAINLPMKVSEPLGDELKSLEDELRRIIIGKYLMARGTTGLTGPVVESILTKEEDQKYD